MFFQARLSFLPHGRRDRKRPWRGGAAAARGAAGLGRRRLTAAAGQLLGLERRQVFRLLKVYRTEGPTGLISKRRGRRSNRRKPEALRRSTSAIIREWYWDFGPTLAAEKLAEHHGCSVSRETLRGWMIGDGLWQDRRHRLPSPHQPRRRRDCLGELVQIDGSEHAWFEDRGPPCTRTSLKTSLICSAALRRSPIWTSRSRMRNIACANEGGSGTDFSAKAWTRAAVRAAIVVPLQPSGMPSCRHNWRARLAKRQEPARDIGNVADRTDKAIDYRQDMRVISPVAVREASGRRRILDGYKQENTAEPGRWSASYRTVVGILMVGDQTGRAPLQVSARRRSRSCARSGRQTFSTPLALRRRRPRG